MINYPRNRRFPSPVRSAVPVLHELFGIIEGQERLTLLDIAVAAGTTTTSLHRWRKGDNVPRVDALSATAEVLGYDLVLVPRKP